MIGNKFGTRPDGRLSFQHNILAGAATGFVAAFVEGPIDLVNK